MAASIRDFRNSRKEDRDLPAKRMRIFFVVVLLAALAIAGRLFVLQILSGKAYAALASNQHGIFQQLFPERGTVYVRDGLHSDERFPVAINKELRTVYADPRQIKDAEIAAKLLAPVLELDETELLEKIVHTDGAYVPLKKRVSEEVVARVKEFELPGIAFETERIREYPEKSFLSHVLGFVGSNEQGQKIGRYGIEGKWEKELSGESGFVAAEKDPGGRIIGGAGSSFVQARDGADLTLTIDRTIQYVACDRLKKAVQKHGAAGGSVVILDPKTGAVLAMCGAPDFDPNDFAKVESAGVFNNPAIFDTYEPGSIFKPVTMSAAIDSGKISPDTTFDDKGAIQIGEYTIRNSDGKAHGLMTMTQVLEESLNTGTIFAMRSIGPVAFGDYVRKFGFGEKTGIELDTEAAGDVSSLSKKGEIFAMTGSFGQGITVTPLQMASAFGVIANGGKLMRSYVVDEVQLADGTSRRTEPSTVRQVISKRTATLVGGMLVNVVERGHGKRAGVKGYWVAGKTGTAQIARRDGQGYEKDAHIGSFAGFAPIDDPVFVMAVEIVRPTDVDWAESSAAPLFGEIAKFLLNYMEIPPTR